MFGVTWGDAWLIKFHSHIVEHVELTHYNKINSDVFTSTLSQRVTHGVVYEPTT